MLASVSLDLDNKWSYLKTHGDERWRDFPSYLDKVVPRILDFLHSNQFKITFFVVGQDAEQSQNLLPLRAIADAGHEIGNHSYRHEPWLHRYGRDEVCEEFAKTESALLKVTSTPLVGFRGPGFSFSKHVLEVMQERGYQYDCSTFPSVLGPAARTYYFLHSNFSTKQKQERKELFGSLKDGFQRLKPYQWQVSGRTLVEIPVTTIPFFRVPFHLSYVMFLAKRSENLAVRYFQMALAICRAAGVEPSILFHPLDFLGVDDEPDLAFFPGMDIEYSKKQRVLMRIFELLEKRFRVVSMQEHAAITRERRLPFRTLLSLST